MSYKWELYWGILMQLTKNTYLNTSLWAFLLWVSVYYISWDFILANYIIVLVCLFLLVFWTYIGQWKNLIIIVLITLGMWVSYTHISYQKVTEWLSVVAPYVGLYNSYEWEVLGVRRRSDFYDEYIIDLRQIDSESIRANISHLLRVPKNFSLSPGQEIRYQGKMYEIEDFDGFAYKKYLLSQGIYFSTSTNTLDTLSQKKDYKYTLYTSREHLLEKIRKIFPEQEAIFLWGILFGARENIPSELKEDFNNSGLTHFIAVSGFNITLCIIFSVFLFGFLPSFLRVIMVIGVIAGFSFFVGLGAPVVRAAIMGIIGYIFLEQWNGAKNMSVLLFSALCMTLYSPLSLIYDVSLHLSFLAVIWIIYTQDIFKKCCFWIPQVFAMREAFVLTLAALSFSLPIMIFQFGQVSLLAPFANIAVTWTIPLAMLGGAVTLIVDSFSPYLWHILGFITWILLHYDMQMVAFFGNIEWALWHVDIWVYAPYAQTFYFMLLIYLLSIFHLGKKKQL